MPEGIGYPKQATAEQHMQRKGCIETLMELGLTKEEAAKRCFGPYEIKKDWSAGYADIAKQHARHKRETRFQDSFLGTLLSALGVNNDNASRGQ